MSIICKSVDILFNKGNSHKSKKIEKVLENINLELLPGEIVLLYSPSGMGKTSLFNILSGIASPSNPDAEVSWYGYKVKNLDKANLVRYRYLSIIFSYPFFMNSLSVEQNITLPAILAKKNMIEIKARLELIYEVFRFENKFPKLDLRGLTRTPLANLSNGQKDLVSIARALMLNNPFILADEMLRSYSEDESDEIWNRITSPTIGIGKNRGLFLISKHKHIWNNYSAQRKFTIEEHKLVLDR